jgi:heme oxygenase
MVEQAERVSIMQTLKESTWELHQSAERHQVQQALVGGSLPVSAYTLYLSQMWSIHRCVEAACRRLQYVPPFCHVVREYHYREDLLRADLDYFEIEIGRVRPLPATRELVDKIDESIHGDHVSALGFLYVLEGSTNGSKFIARRVRPAYGLESGDGSSYLDPHGDKQTQRWAAFKSDMSEVEFDVRHVEVMVRSAKMMFLGLVHISDGLSAQLQ